MNPTLRHSLEKNKERFSPMKLRRRQLLQFMLHPMKISSDRDDLRANDFTGAVLPGVVALRPAELEKLARDCTTEGPDV